MKQLKILLVKLKALQHEFIIKYINSVMVDCVANITVHFKPNLKSSLLPIPTREINDPFISNALDAFKYYQNFTRR